MRSVRLIFLLLLLSGSTHAFTGSRNFSDTLVIPFEYKQSAIVHKFTLTPLDSVVRILNANKDVTLSIEGYAYVDEGNDTICKYLSLNRALFVRDCITGRGIDSSRISAIKAMGQWKPEKKGHYKVNDTYHCRVEVLLIYPPPPKPIVIADRDEDGVSDDNDSCPDVYGYADKKGCPNENVVIVRFENTQSYITSPAYIVLDNLLEQLRQNSAYTILINGHASKEEGTKSVSDRLSSDRADIVYRYLSSRNLPASRIEGTVSYGKSRPVNAQRNPKEISDNASVEILVNKH